MLLFWQKALPFLFSCFVWDKEQKSKRQKPNAWVSCFRRLLVLKHTLQSMGFIKMDRFGNFQSSRRISSRVKRTVSRNCLWPFGSLSQKKHKSDLPGSFSSARALFLILWFHVCWYSCTRGGFLFPDGASECIKATVHCPYFCFKNNIFSGTLLWGFVLCKLEFFPSRKTILILVFCVYQVVNSDLVIYNIFFSPPRLNLSCLGFFQDPSFPFKCGPGPVCIKLPTRVLYSLGCFRGSGVKSSDFDTGERQQK